MQAAKEFERVAYVFGIRIEIGGCEYDETYIFDFGWYRRKYEPCNPAINTDSFGRGNYYTGRFRKNGWEEEGVSECAVKNGRLLFRLW